MTTEPPPLNPRGRYEGMINILRFNWPMYVRASVVAIGLGLLILVPGLPFLYRALFGLAALGSIFYLWISLVVSHLIYDRSPLYALSWLDQAVSTPPEHIINLTAGFDETTLRLKAKYPGAEVEVLDFYDSRVHTEPSIARARAYRPPLAETRQVSPAFLALKPHSIDLALGILAIHEIRQPQDRAALFHSIGAALRPGGRCVVVEHLRNMPNFMAFGPGFFHFFPRSAWLEASQSKMLRLVNEFTITPFVHIFVLEKLHV